MTEHGSEIDVSVEVQIEDPVPSVIPAKPQPDKLNVSFFFMAISIFLTTSILMTNYYIRALIIRSVRDYSFYGVPILWVMTKEEIKEFAMRRFNQALAGFGYF